MKSIFIKLSGTALDTNNQNIDINYLQNFARFVSGLKIKKIAITIGGGKLARVYISSAKKLGETDTNASLLGGEIGLLNCRLLIAALKKHNCNVYSTPLESWDKAREVLDSGYMPIMYGKWPGLTSDAVAAYFADYCSMNLVIKISRIDAIYDKNPDTNATALPIRNISYQTLEKMAMESDQRVAGSNFVLDLLAIRRLKNSSIPMMLVHKSKLSYISELLEQKKWNNINEGTLLGKINL